jgi:PleD family two-component response regulator
LELFSNLSNAAQTNAASRQNGDTRRHRVLVITESRAGASLPAQLARAGYEVRAARTAQAAQLIAEFAPHVVLVEAQAGAGGEASLELASRLRAARQTSALPLVLLFDDEDANLRAAALRIGVDDYFALHTPPAEIASRLDALFWRTEAGRRTATLAALERRAEIDDFLQLLEAVRADIEAGLTGTLALVAAATPPRAPDEINAGAVTTTTPEARAFAAAHDFFQLNLRRVDAVAFYGPTLLLAYLPQKTRAAARTDLARLSEEFQATPERVNGSLDIGLASFPTDGTEIESLIERAEAALQQTRPPHAEEDAQGTSANARPESKPAGIAAAPAPHASRDLKPSAAPETATTAERHARAAGELSPSRAVRESKQTDMETSMMPAGGAGGGGVGQGTLAQSAAAAAARERERRTRGAIMPRRLLLTVSDPARMAQINLLLRSAGYEVRAAFDGLQAINLLRIERPDLLVIDMALYGIDGLEALRRLHRQHQGRLPLPIVLLLPETSMAAERERVRAEARELGVVSFVAVPYDPEELLTCVRTVGSTD